MLIVNSLYLRHIASLAAVLAACSDEPPLVFDMQASDFSCAEQADVYKAADKWNAVAIEPIAFGRGEWRIDRVDLPIGTAGETSLSKHVIRIAQRHEATTFQVILHEFGHAHRLSHVASGVMQPAAAPTEFTAEDMAECRRVEACR